MAGRGDGLSFSLDASVRVVRAVEPLVDEILDVAWCKAFAGRWPASPI
jgi:hypothetical protein